MELVCKILLLGDGGVGKTTIRQNFIGIKSLDSSRYIMTIGSDLSMKNITIQHSGEISNIKLLIWDLAGQPTFSRVRPRYYEGGQAVLLVYDVIARDSFHNMLNWVTELKTNIDTFPVPMILVANKCDLRDVPNQNLDEQSLDLYVTAAEGQEFAEYLTNTYFQGDWNVPYIETSALTGQNIEYTFMQLGKLFIKMASNE